MPARKTSTCINTKYWGNITGNTEGPLLLYEYVRVLVYVYRIQYVDSGPDSATKP